MEDKTLPPQPLDKWMLDALACPCSAHLAVCLNSDKTALLCSCGRYAFAVSAEGIPNMLIEEAEILNPDAEPSQVSSVKDTV